MMTNERNQQIIDSGKDFFREIIIPVHLKNLNELQLKDFNVNPFLIKMTNPGRFSSARRSVH